MQTKKVGMLTTIDQTPTASSLTSLATALLSRITAVQAASVAVMEAAPSDRAAQLERLAQAHHAYMQQVSTNNLAVLA